MAIHFAGTSLADFISAGSGPTSYTSTNKDTYVAEGFQVSGSGAPAGVFDLPVGLSELWCSFYMAHNSGTGTAQPGIEFINKAISTTLFRLRGGSNNTTMGANYWNGSADVNFANGTGSGMQNLHRYDIHIKIADTGGIFDVYRDGVLDITLATGDTKWTAATTIDRISLGVPGVSTAQYSAIIVADEDTRDLRMSQVLANGAGSDSAWTNSYTTIDELGVDDADFIYSSTVNQVSTFAFPAINAFFNTASWEVKAVIENVRGATTIDATVDVAPIVRTASTNYEGAALGFGGAISAKMHQWTINPNTGMAWNFSDASGAQLGVKVVAP